MRFALLALLIGASGARADDFGINVYGASYHFPHEQAQKMGLTHEFNPGVGLRWRREYNGSWDLFIDGGAYSDSKGNTAFLFGGGSLWHATDHLRLGGALVALNSDTYNHGKAFVAPVPVATYEGRRMTFNMVYFPKWQDINKTNQVGFWLTVWLN